MYIRYIDHSGFLIESRNAYFLFDLVKGELPLMARDRKLFVFVSHRHPDHFSKRIFGLGADGIFIDNKAGDHIDCFPYFKASCHPSTDEGVCFLLEIEEKRIYFAGDNADWFWDGDEQDIVLRRRHSQILERIGKVDLAFVPIDPRLPDMFSTLEEVERLLMPDKVVPMHMWGKEKKVQASLNSVYSNVDFRHEIYF